MQKGFSGFKFITLISGHTYGNENDGIIFVRTDLEGKPEIPADIDHVVDISRGTTIGLGEATVATIEHVLAAIVGLDIDNITFVLQHLRNSHF